jgi:hypothetical protein
MRYVLVALLFTACTSNGEFTCTPICSPGPGGGQDTGGTATFMISAASGSDAQTDCVDMAKDTGSGCPANYTPVSCTCTE